MTCWKHLFMTLIVLLGGVEIGLAHKPSDSYLRFLVDDRAITGQWDIALRDLDHVLGLDANQDGVLTWGEVRTRQEAISAYAFSRLQVEADGLDCRNRERQLLIDHHSDGTYAVLRFVVECLQVPTVLNLRYGLLFERDPLHRGLLNVTSHGHTQTGVFSPEYRSLDLDLERSTAWNELWSFGREGVWHIWIGFDHILFLISLLLPSVLWWKAGNWQVEESFPRVFHEVFRIITAFTVAHSITLGLATFNLINLPAQWVESVIAGSVVLAALHNLFPLVQVRRWLVGFVFGLVHGFGFASVLSDLALPSSSMFVALAGFNLGVEVGQLAIVGVFLPLAFMIRSSWMYRHLVLQGGSVAIAGIAFIWLLERSLGLSFTTWF